MGTIFMWLADFTMQTEFATLKLKYLIS